MANRQYGIKGKSLAKQGDEATLKEVTLLYVMLEAKAMLTNTDMTISQISDHLHFPDTSTFGKYFRRHTGLSPKEFKKQSGQ